MKVDSHTLFKKEHTIGHMSPPLLGVRVGCKGNVTLLLIKEKSCDEELLPASRPVFAFGT